MFSSKANPTRTVPRERLLLVLAGVFVVLAHAGLMLTQQRSLIEGWRLLVWCGCAVYGHVLLTRRLPTRDPLLFPIIMLLSGWGLVVIARLEPSFAERQAVWLVVALAGMVAVCLAPRHLRWLSRYRYLWSLSGVALLVLTALFGRNPSGFGPRLWLGIADIYVQPSELMKLLLVVFLASYIADHLNGLNTLKLGWLPIPAAGYLIPAGLMSGTCIVLMLWQRDLGAAALYFLVFILMIYLASGNGLVLVGAVAFLCLAGGIAYFTIDVVRLRIDIWLDPWRDPNGTAYQIVQSLLAFAAGGIGGQGAGQGSPSYIPVAHSDFAFAALAEEWGLLGSVAVILCLALLILRGFRVAAQQQKQPFRALLAAGISLTLGVQSLMIMGGALRLIPLTGVTLPFISYGGSSLVISFVMVGLLVVLSEEP